MDALNASSSNSPSGRSRCARCWSSACSACPIAARINRGPLFLREASRDVQVAVLRALRQRWRYGRRGLLLMAPSLPEGSESTALLRAAGFTARKAGGWGSALIDLPPSLEAIRAGLSSKWRNHLNGSLKAGIAVRISGDREVFDWMLDQHASNMAIKGYVGPSVPFVQNMIASSPQDFSVFQAYIDNQPVSAILLARFGTHAETYLSWTGEAGRRSNAHHLLLWHVIAESKAAGCHAHRPRRLHHQWKIRRLQARHEGPGIPAGRRVAGNLNK